MSLAPPVSTAPPAGHGRCAIHNLGAGPDGRCVLCRRAAAPRTGAGDRWVLGGVMVLLVALAGGIVWKVGRTVAQGLAAREAAHQAGAPENRVRLYTTKWCPHCARAKGWLNGQHVDYVSLDIEADPWALRENRRLNPRGSIPTFDANGEVVIGFDPQAYTAALERGAAHAPR